MIFQSNSPLSAISTEPRFKYLSPQAKKLFDDAKAKYLVLVGNTPENSQKFDNFVNNIDKNRSAASAINDAVDLNNGTDRALLKKSIFCQVSYQMVKIIRSATTFTMV